MLKKILILLALVIILVSLNWFEVLVAQDLDGLSAEEKAALLEQYRTRSTAVDSDRYYESPRIYADDESVAHQPNMPVDYEKDVAGEKSGPMAGATLVDFDELLPFGMELFKGGNSNDIPADVPSADDYVLGPGDNIIIYLWGRAEKEYNLTFDREGRVVIPQVGELVGWGLTLEQFRHRARNLFSQAYSEFDLTVSLGRIRSIRIYVAGEVRNPGAYTVSSLTSLFNALYIAGGPNERGSMRGARLMRAGKMVAEIDLYRLLLEGDNSNDLRLQTGDVIFVPVAGTRVAVRGEINRPAIYELKGGETVADLLALAGNPTPRAYLERIMLERIAANDEWKVLDLNLSQSPADAADNIALADGDRLTIFSIFEAKQNIVAIQGRVKHAGYYERNDSTHLSDLVARAQLQAFDVYYERADLFRRYPDGRVEVLPVNLGDIVAGIEGTDIKLRDRDSLHIYAVDEVSWKKYVYIEGEVVRPGRYPLYEGMKVQDLIFLSGSYTRGAHRRQAEIARLDSAGEVSIHYLQLENPASDTIILREDDHLYIRQMPLWQTEREVTIDGEVMYPGSYTLSGRSESFYQLIQRAGGFTPHAFPKGTIFTRASIYDNLRRSNITDVVQKSVPIVEDSTGLRKPATTIEFDQTSMNRIVIDMDHLLVSKGFKGDIMLQPGDRIHVPAIPSGISVVGATSVNGTIKFMPGENVKYYIKRAGNFSRQADKKETRLVKASGEVENGGGLLGRRVELGDVIIVPTKIDKQRDWTKTITAAITTVTGVLTSVFIVSKL